jgi:hypothetical protein
MWKSGTQENARLTPGSQRTQWKGSNRMNPSSWSTDFADLRRMELIQICGHLRNLWMNQMSLSGPNQNPENPVNPV